MNMTEKSETVKLILQVRNLVERPEIRSLLNEQGMKIDIQAINSLLRELEIMDTL